jgi:hypothetical protein
MKTSHIVLLVIGLAFVGFLVYWFAIRKPAKLTVPKPSPATAQSDGFWGFASNIGKKAFDTFGDAIVDKYLKDEDE